MFPSKPAPPGRADRKKRSAGKSPVMYVSNGSEQAFLPKMVSLFRGFFVPQSGVFSLHTISGKIKFSSEKFSVSTLVEKIKEVRLSLPRIQMTWLICMALNLPPEAFAAFAS